jgi:hypothetical protein
MTLNLSNTGRYRYEFYFLQEDPLINYCRSRISNSNARKKIVSWTWIS